jgi:Holliday junction resolvase RusA-like endonuclease
MKPLEAHRMIALYAPAAPKQERAFEPLSIRFVFPGQPISAKRPRVTQRGTFTDPVYARYKANLTASIEKEFGHLSRAIPPVGSKERSKYMATHRYKLAADFYMQDRRHVDCDNLIKGVLDALQAAGILANDSQVDETLSRKHHDPAAPRLEVTLEELA